MTIKQAVNRRVLMRMLAAVSLATTTWAAQAQAFPNKPIRFVVPYPPGGASDVTARLIADKLGPLIGQSVIVENRPGANGIIALEAVAKAPPDGYTILMGNVGPNAINAGLYPKLPFDPIKSFAPITLTSTVPIVLLVNPASRPPPCLFSSCCFTCSSTSRVRGCTTTRSGCSSCRWFWVPG